MNRVSLLVLHVAVTDELYTGMSGDESSPVGGDSNDDNDDADDMSEWSTTEDDDIIMCAHDVDSVVLPIATEDLLSFSEGTLVTVNNYPVMIKDIRGAICVAEFGWRVFAVLSQKQKERICKTISSLSV